MKDYNNPWQTADWKILAMLVFIALFLATCRLYLEERITMEVEFMTAPNDTIKDTTK